MTTEWTVENKAWLVDQVLGTLYECTSNDTDTDIDNDDLIEILEMAVAKLKVRT